MTVTIHAVPAPLLTAEEIGPWRAVPVAVAVDLVPDQQIDPAIRPLNPPGRQPLLTAQFRKSRSSRSGRPQPGRSASSICRTT